MLGLSGGMDSTTRRLAEFEAWLGTSQTQAALGKEHAGELRVKVKQLKDRLQRPPAIPIALLGSTGAGKSTLINSLVGENVLSTNTSQFCTAAVTVVGYQNIDHYRGRLAFMTEEEWEADARWALEYLAAAQASADEGEEGGDFETRRHFERKLRTIYQLGNDEPIPSELPELPLAVAHWLSQSIKEEWPADSVAELRHDLKDFVTSDGQFWPIVKQAEIYGRFKGLEGGIQLVDLPGLNDPNPAREQITRDYLKQSPHVWLVFNAKRGVTRELRDFLRQENLIRQMMMNGNLPGFAMVATHADDIDFDEQTLETLGLDQDASEAEVVGARNQRVFQNCRETLGDLARDIAEYARAREAELQNLLKALETVHIFTVASRSYQKASGLAAKSRAPELSAEETQIPAVLGHIRNIAQKRGTEHHIESVNGELELLVRETESFFRSAMDELAATAQSTQARRQRIRQFCTGPQHEHRGRLNEVGVWLKATFDAQRQALHERLNTASLEAKEKVQAAIDQWRLLHHYTLSSLTRNNGRFKSINGKTTDLNAGLAAPLTQAIPFAWSEFFGARVDGMVDLLAEKLISEANFFLKEVEIAALRSKLDDEGVLDALPGSLDTALWSVEFQCRSAREVLDRRIREVRIQLNAGIEEAAKQAMMPAYVRAAQEKGAGKKQRILAHLEERARGQVNSLFETIRVDLEKGVVELGAELAAKTGELCQYVDSQTGRVVGNLTAVVDSAESLAERQTVARMALETIPKTEKRASAAGGLR